VKKGSKATFILVPWLKNNKEEEEKKDVLIGFLSKPVFPVEFTDGEPLDYQQIELPKLPLIERAQEWGISVKAIPDNDGYYGCFSQSKGEIKLATPEESVFFHELTHTADAKILGALKGGQDPIQEIVAELGALSLCHLVGKDGSKFLGNSYRYIERYAKELKVSPYTACLKVISRVEKCLNLILKGGVYEIPTKN